MATQRQKQRRHARRTAHAQAPRKPKMVVVDQKNLAAALAAVEVVPEAQAHAVAEALESANPTGLVLGEDERAVVASALAPNSHPKNLLEMCKTDTLRTLAAQHGIVGRSKMTKAALVASILTAQ